MTPIANFYAKFLPAWLVVLALAFTYAGMMFLILAAGNSDLGDIRYIDVRGFH